MFRWAFTLPPLKCRKCTGSIHIAQALGCIVLTYYPASFLHRPAEVIWRKASHRLRGCSAWATGALMCTFRTSGQFA